MAARKKAADKVAEHPRIRAVTTRSARGRRSTEGTDVASTRSRSRRKAVTENTEPVTIAEQATNGNGSEASDGTKRCSGIKLLGRPAHDAPLSEFGKNKAQPDGLARECKACWNAYFADLTARKKAAAAEAAAQDAASAPAAIAEDTEDPGDPGSVAFGSIGNADAPDTTEDPTAPGQDAEEVTTADSPLSYEPVEAEA
jgi:hypothetical protein